MGAKGCLYYQTARDAADYACWDARDRGGKIDVFDQQERLFRSIVIETAELTDSGFDAATRKNAPQLSIG